MGYFALGYVLRKWGNKHKDNRKDICLIGIFVMLFASYCRYQQALAGLSELDISIKLLGYFNPLPMLGSICIFLGFSRIKVKRSFARMSDISLYISASCWCVGCAREICLKRNTWN